MRVMRWIKEQEEKETRAYYAVLVVAFLLGLVFALLEMIYDVSLLPKGEVQIAWDNHFLWYVLFAAALVGIIYIWVYYAPVVCNDVDRLKDAFSDSGYHDLYERFEGWLQRCSRKPPGRGKCFHIIYAGLWLLYLGCFSCYYGMVLCQYYQDRNIACCIAGSIIFFVLTFTITALNYFSCYICIAFVYFLIQIWKLDKIKHLTFLKKAPSATFGLQLLSHTANTICLYFFLDSFFVWLAFCPLEKLLAVKAFQ